MSVGVTCSEIMAGPPARPGRFLLTPEQHRSAATRLRARGMDKEAQQREGLARMIEALQCSVPPSTARSGQPVR
jgi:hypothetical protein